MGFYSEVVFPFGMNFIMSGKDFQQQRAAVLESVSGNILEIGFGTGLNLPHYPATTKKLTVIDPNPGMGRYAARRIEVSPIDVERQVLGGEALPMGDDSFDTVVSTWTLCSIADIDRAITEVRRVLKPGGRFVFLEHGLSPDPAVSRWQHRLDGIQQVIGDGCHLNRDMRAIIGRAGFAKLEIENYYLPGTPRIVGYMYRGVATK